MSYEFDSTEDVGGEGTGLNKPGVYHMVITTIHDGSSNKGKAIEGFTADLAVLNDGPEREKVLHLALFNADGSKSAESQLWSRKKQTAFFIAANLMRPDQLGTRVSIDVTKAEGHQIVIELQEEEYDGKTNLRLSYANIYHVDDPRAAKHPKDAASLTIIPAQFRHVSDAASYFAKLLAKKPSGGNGSGGKSSATAKVSQTDLAGL